MIKTTFTTQRKPIEIINAAGKKTGLKEIDEWLANPQTDHKWDFIYRVKIEPKEFSLNGENRKIETIDFFANANTRLYFLLANALKDNNNFSLQWLEEWVGKYIDFAKNHSNTLVVYSNFLDLGKNKTENEKIKQNSDFVKDLKVDWKNINLLEYGFCFDLFPPQSISINNRNFTYDKVFLSMDYSKDQYEWLKKRLGEWKEDGKDTIIKDAILSTKSWLSVKDSSNLYIIDNNGIKGLHNEWFGRIVFKNEINDWDKLSYSKKKKFLKRWPNESVKDMKKEIEKAIQELENGNDNERKPPVKNSSVPQFPWKIVGGVVFLLIFLVVIIIWLKKHKTKT
ncbi:MAG: hypothetical protein I3273_02050 [Candidatus Moeniiplasma glomeromycotorum]|nr:hypothetical protein [Candidatus Moeniiplasma glomeromycotorum]MCE8167098.1 hypothetical protein [Candidatus Moeniiplasma glomeromycotorum]MCE8168890.1 hypothetical protein [Candidatus Moeniiplasma glomeromycotorum]